MAIKLRASLKYIWLTLGLCCTVIGVIGVILPGLPGTVFLLVAVWAFSKSSDRFHTWLYTHPILGKPMQDWHEYGVIPVRAKVLAVAMMAISVYYLVAFSSLSGWIVAVCVAVIVPIAVWIVTRPSIRAI